MSVEDAQNARHGTAAADEHDAAEVHLVARGIATAVSPAEGLTDVQAQLLGAIAKALTGRDVDYHDLEPLGPDDLVAVLADRDIDYRRRIVQHMVLGELVLRPLPIEVAARVARYAETLGVTDQFVRVARRYAQGAYGLAWIDLRRSGFVEHVVESAGPAEPTSAPPGIAPAAFEPATVDPELEAQWAAFADLPDGTLGRAVSDVYASRGFALPGSPGGAPKYLAQHDFVHVLADYGTNVRGELEVFAFIGRADPDPKGFAWLATLIGLFETGYIETTGFFERDIRERNIQAPGMDQRLADAIRRGKVVCDFYGTDLFEVDYSQLVDQPVPDVRRAARNAGEVSGRARRRLRGCIRPRRNVGDTTSLRRATGGNPTVNVNFTQTIAVRCDDPDALIALYTEWDHSQATADIMGYMGGHLLADRDNPGLYLIVAEFGVVDPDVSAADEAMRNNERPETHEWARRLRELIDGEPDFRHYDEIYRTG